MKSEKYLYGWKVSHNPKHGWYIYNKPANVYLRKDNSLSDLCGLTGFWNKENDAISFLERWLHVEEEFLTKEEMEI